MILIVPPPTRAARHLFVGPAVAALLVMTLLSGCGEGTGASVPVAGDQVAPTTINPAATPTTRPEEPLEPPVLEGIGDAMPLDLVLYGAGAVVRAEVVDIRGPFWNTADGKEWSDQDVMERLAYPTQYREVDLKVLEYYRDEIGLGEVATIVARGDGGPPPLADLPPVIRLDVGDEVVVALVDAFFTMREGPVDRLYPLGGGTGVLDVIGDAAWSQGTAEAIALDEITSRLEQLRAEDHSEWDYFRYPPTAAQQAERVARMIAEIRAENDRTERDLNNICDFVGDPERAQQWLDANPDKGITLEAMLDPIWFVDLCDGSEESNAQELESDD
jgi:hypothetical protein